MQSKALKQNMTTGKLLPQMILFTLPVLFTGVLQLLYNAADLVVVGKWADDYALAAVGSTGSLISLIVNLFIGLSVGANVLVARYVGEKNEEGISRAVHTSVVISIVFGVLVGIFGMCMAKTLLTWMDSPEEVIDLSALYVRIYFAGMPFTMLYNFGAAILRGMGDTKRPLIALATSGILNVGLNMILVIGFHRSVDGVAIATVVSQAYACFMVLGFLIKSKNACRLCFKKLRIHKTELFFMARIGLPAGIQGSLFSISNVLIQSAINSFGPIAVSGNSAAGNIEGFVYTSMNAVYQTVLTFVGQNCGAGKWKRVKRVLFVGFGIVTVIGLVMGVGCFLLGKFLLGFYTDTAEAIAFGLTRMRYICLWYVFCGWMEVLVGQMRGMGYSFIPMAASFIGVCGFRIFWIYTVFKANHTLPTLYISYPISWLITIVIYVVTLLILWNVFLKKRMPPDASAPSKELKQKVLSSLQQNGITPLAEKELSAALSLSKKQVSQTVRALKKDGYRISHLLRGYRLKSEQPLVIEQRLKTLLGDTVPPLFVQIEEEVTSTNLLLKKQAEADAPEGSLLVAHGQTGGKGRHGRTFHSPRGTGLYFSLLLRPNCHFSESVRITTAAAVCAARAVEAVAPNATCSLKWVNDVYIGGRKVCGVLTEGAINGEGNILYSVLGVGINLQKPKGGFHRTIKRIAGAISKKTVDASALLAAFLQEFFAVYPALNAPHLIQEYRSRSMLIGKRVTVLGNAPTPFCATVRGIDDDFSLIVTDDNGTTHRLSSGEVSVLLA